MAYHWKKVYTTNHRYLADIAKGVLEDHDISSVILNKQDSAYGFGEIELYTEQQHVLRALHIIKKHDL